MRTLITNNLTGTTEEIEIEEVEGGAISKSIVPEPQAPSEAERIEMLENMLLLLMME